VCRCDPLDTWRNANARLPSGQQRVHERTRLEVASLVIISSGRPVVAPHADDVLLAPRRGGG